MKIQDNIDIQTPPPGQPPSKGRARLASLAAFLIVALLVAATAILYVQLGQHRKSQSPASTPPPPAHTWTQVSHGYTFASIMAAGSDAATLYACAFPANTNAASYTILRSTDFGTHWQDVGRKANLGNSCQLAISPTNSSELYALGTSVRGQSATSILLHTADAGQTWNTIQPTLNVPGATTSPVWNAQQLSMVGNALFGVQWLLPVTTHPVPLPKAYARFASLITSTDGGHTWTVIDQHFTSARQFVVSYAVDPSNTNTIYELAGVPWLPVVPAQPDIATIYSNNDTLYKTSDHGATWQVLLQNLPFGTQLHLASGNPQILYVGGSRLPLPLGKGEAPSGEGSIVGSFHLQVSRDGGTSWRDVPALPTVSPETSISSWMVDANGQVYINPASSVPSGGQPTPVTGTVVPSNHLLIPPTVPQSNMPTKAGDLYHFVLTTPPPAFTPGPFVPIFRYDPASNAWSSVTTPPAYGTLFATTPGSTNGTVLWLQSTQNGQANVYRYLA